MEPGAGHYLVVGRAGMDLAPEPAGAAIETVIRFSASLGGSAANIAVGLARLGSNAALLSAVSDDPVGHYCLNQLEGYGVETHLIARSGFGTRTSLALTEARVENHHTVLYRNNPADFEITRADCEAIDLAKFSTIIVTGTALAEEPSRSSVLELMKRARSIGLQTVLDIDYRPNSWISGEEAAKILSAAAALCELIVGNDEEFDVLAGDAGGGLDHARRLAGRNGCIVIYKRGAKGAITLFQDRKFSTGIWPATPLKPTGAGDSFLAAFLVALNGNIPLQDAVLRGSAAAAMVVSRPGCAPAMPTSTELDAFITRHKSPHLETTGNDNAHSTP